MKKEIQQPRIEIPSYNDLTRGTLLPPVHTEWLRHVSPQLGLDSKKLVLGYALNSIPDDGNLFIWTMKGEFFDAETGSGLREQLIARLDWKIVVPEVPKEIRAEIENLKQSVGQLDWSSYEQFEQASSAWFSFSDWAEEYIRKTPRLKEARAYYIRKKGDLDEYWNAFLGES